MTNSISVKQLPDLRDILWVTIPREELSEAHQVLWYAANELSGFLELSHMGPKEAVDVSPDTLTIIRSAVACLGELSQLPSFLTASVLVRVNRYLAGDDDGLSWKSE